MKKTLANLSIALGLIILLGGLLSYGLGINNIIPVPRPDLIVSGTTLIGIIFIVSGTCDLFVKKTREMEIEEKDERNIALGNAAMAEAVKMVAGRAKTEASGNMSIQRLKEVAATGVDYISVGALTHSVKALDISMNIETE